MYLIFVATYNEIVRNSCAFATLLQEQIFVSCKMLTETFDKKSCNHLFWSPNGQFLVLAGLRR